MMQRKTTRLHLFFSLFLALFFAPGVSKAAGEYTAITPLATPAETPSITFQDEKGNAHTLKEFAGKPVVLHFWATWCAPCVKELPQVEAAQKKYPDIAFIPVALEFKGVQAAREFYITNKLVLLPLFADSSMESFKSFKLAGLPSSLLLNKEGKILARMEGPIDWQASKVQQTLTALKDGSPLPLK